MHYKKEKIVKDNNKELNNKMQYRINSKGEKRKVVIAIPLFSFLVFLFLLYILTIELQSMYYEVDMNDVIKKFDIQLSTNVMALMNYNAFQYEIENIEQLENSGITENWQERQKRRQQKNQEYKWLEDIEYFDSEEEEEVSFSEISTNNYVTSTGEKYRIIANLKIPSLDIDYPILSSTSEELLKISITKYWGAAPNTEGNMVVLGHNYESKRFFSKLHHARNGMKLYVTDLSGQTLEYSVYDTQIIDPNDNSCTSQLTDGNTDITLITCYNRDKNRFVVKARANK
ncbi:MAG: sortase [Clostridia bacterium]|nr:sortase [Clostridia bacterium]